jgi:hypothetical protein
MPSADRPRQSIPAGPFRTPVRDTPPLPELLPAGSLPKGDPARAIMTGQAGVNLVQSCFLNWGLPAHTAMEGMSYDIIVDTPRLGLLRVQVKTISRPRNEFWSFALKRGFYRSRKGMFNYRKDDFDLAAFVCLSLNRLFFVSSPISKISVPTSAVVYPRTEAITFNYALRSLEKRRTAEQLGWLAAMPANALPAPSPTPTAANTPAHPTPRQAGPAAVSPNAVAH